MNPNAGKFTPQRVREAVQKGLRRVQTSSVLTRPKQRAATQAQIERQPERTKFTTDFNRFARETDQQIPPGVSIWATGQYGFDSDKDAFGDMDLEQAVATILDRHQNDPARNSLERTKAAYDLMLGPTYRMQRQAGDGLTRELAGELLRSVEDLDGIHFGVRMGSESDDGIEPDDDAPIEQDVEAVLDNLEEDEATRFVQRGGCPMASCRTCLVSMTYVHPVTLVNKKRTVAVITRVQSLCGVPADFFDTLAKFVDPRSWALITGPTIQDPSVAGWVQSMPATDAGGVVSHNDLFAANQRVELGQPWKSDFLEEVHNFGFKNWKVVLGIDFTRTDPSLGTNTGGDLRVEYELRRQLAGPAGNTLSRDNGYLHVSQDSPTDFTVEMVKEIDFEDQGGGPVGLESYLPFVACSWFDDIYDQWSDAILTTNPVDLANDAEQMQFIAP